MFELDLTNFNILIAVGGGFLLVFGLVSHGVKQRLLISEALIAVLAGVLFTHIALFVQPSDYACGGEPVIKSITLEFSRLILGVSLVFAGVELPPQYVYSARTSLFYLLGPGLMLTWLCAGLIIWWLLPQLGLLGALAIAACVAPTDPILSNAIIHGRYAELNTPKPMRRLISAEAGLNDGLGYPFLFFCLLWLKYVQAQGDPMAMFEMWATQTLGYVIILSVIYGAFVGLAARKLHLWSLQRGYIEEESSLTFIAALSLFVLGTSGMINTDDVLACFVAGTSFGWDRHFRPSSAHKLFCSSIDMLLNTGIFMWYGAVAPWDSFVSNSFISLPKLILLGILVLVLRRLPVVLLLKNRIDELETFKQAAFMGFFGPIGVSAIYYVMLGRQFLLNLAETSDESTKAHALYLEEVMWIVIWFLVMCSVFIHGMALPVSKVLRWGTSPLFGKHVGRKSMSDEYSAGVEAGEQQRIRTREVRYGTMSSASIV